MTNYYETPSNIVGVVLAKNFATKVEKFMLSENATTCKASKCLGWFESMVAKPSVVK